MTRIRFILTASLYFTFVFSASAQDSLLTAMARNNVTTFTKQAGTFTGPGWQKIVEKATASNDVLIGEDHFTNEIPYFTSAIAATFHFDNFFCEIDPYTAAILQDKISNLSPAALQAYVNAYGNTFSFYAFAPEFELLKQLTKAHTTIRGTDQVLLIGDRLICDELQKMTKDKTAKQLYRQMADSSKVHFDRFLEDKKTPFYFLTDDFSKNIDKLSFLKLSKHETEVIAAMKMSVKIYKTQSHELRIQLMKHQLMDAYGNWYGKRNLFKYGANHLAKGESLLDIYDVGNLVSSLNDANYTSSLHIMILGISGTQASPFEGFPSERIDADSGIFKTLKPITKTVEGKDWHCFDLLPLREALNDGKLNIKSVKMQRIIKGYDLLVVIPEVSASGFAKKR